jgi:hypothetical protein
VDKLCHDWYSGKHQPETGVTVWPKPARKRKYKEKRDSQYDNKQPRQEIA